LNTGFWSSSTQSKSTAASIAALFAGLGIWLGLKLTRNKEKIVIKEVPIAAPERFTLNQSRLQELGITPRELEILELNSARAE
jgi:hypothetical protein